MTARPSSPSSLPAPADSPVDLRELFHRLNNQLGIVLANAELLETRLTDRATRARATLVIDGALDAMATVRELRSRVDAVTDGDRSTR